MPPHHSRSKLQAVLEESTSTAAKHPSVTTAVKSMANVLLGPRGKTPIENMLTMQHFQLWGFILVVAGLVYIVWLMQKKLDNIDKQYKEQFVLLHRLFKSHQDLQVEVRKNKPVSTTTTTTVHTPPTNNTVSLALEAEEDIVFDEERDEVVEDHRPESAESAESSESSSSSASSVQSDPEAADANDESEDAKDDEAEEVDYEEYDEDE